MLIQINNGVRVDNLSGDICSKSDLLFGVVHQNWFNYLIALNFYLGQLGHRQVFGVKLFLFYFIIQALTLCNEVFYHYVGSHQRMVGVLGLGLNLVQM
jgi:hypothetical protein